MARNGNRITALAVFFFILISISISISMAHSHLHAPFQLSGRSPAAKKLRPWPCCDSCGACTKSIPPQCQCRDLVRACHPMCNNCVRSPLSADPPLYQCMDFIPNYCKYNCTSNLNMNVNVNAMPRQR